MPIGYHYTAASKVALILDRGLLPQPVPSHIHRHFDATVPSSSFVGWNYKGIWLWTSQLDEESHAGTLIFCAQRHKDLTVAVLKVTYEHEDIVLPSKDRLALKHRGAIADWVYHTAEPAVLAVRPIPAERIEVAGIYDILKRLSHRQPNAKVSQEPRHVDRRKSG